MLNKKEYVFRDPAGKRGWIDIEICQSARYGAPGMRREKRKKPTPEQVKKQNLKNKEIRIWRYIRANFEEGDYWITLTYRPKERPPDVKIVQDHFAKFRKKIRGAYRKYGYELKYIYSIEVGSKGGIHIHMILNRMDKTDQEIVRAWSRGHAHITPLYREGEYRKLAAYIAKADIYNHSRNLIFPRRRVKQLRNRAWKRQPRAYKGYYVDKNSIVTGINPVTGTQFMHYTMVRFRRD